MQLSIEHRPQIAEYGCLSACVEMATAHIGLRYTQKKLNKLFDLGEYGVPFSRLSRLEKDGLIVMFEQGDTDDLRTLIDRSIPPIVFVRTADLSYWQDVVAHAILVTGYDEHHFTLHDPFFDTPQTVYENELLLAWDAFNYRYTYLQH